MTEIVKSKKTRLNKIVGVLSRILFLMFLAFLILMVYVVPRLPFYTQKVADFYSEKVFPKIAIVGNSLCNFTYNSITELVVVVGSIMLVAITIYVIVMLIVKIVKGGFWAYFYKVVTVLLVATLFISTSFQLMHGLNYKRTPVDKAIELYGKSYTLEEIVPVYYWAHDQMVAARSKLGEDCNGVTHMMTSLDEAIMYGNILADTASDYLGLELSETYVRAKPVSLSKYWMYTYITGMYNPIFGEANLNVDYTFPTLMPVTLVHEILHAKGLARESDAELAAILMCCMSDRPDFRYAGFLEIYRNLYWVMVDADLPVSFDSGAYRDLDAYNNYFDSLVKNEITETVAEVSETTNDQYLKSNGQEGGTETYIISNNYYADFYYKFIEPTYPGASDD